MLNDKQKAFARAILRGLSNRDAAIDAGYAKSSASAAGSRLAKDKKILDYISRLENVKANVKEDVAEFVPVGTTERVRKGLGIIDGRPDVLDFLVERVFDEFEDRRVQVECAKAVLPYQHSKKGDIGVKQGREDTAKELAGGAGSGRFGTMEPPKIN